MPALVEVTFPRVRGARAVRAAFEPLPPVPAGVWVRCHAARGRRAVPRRAGGADLPRHAGGVPPPRGGGPGQSALLRALEHAGLVEILDAQAWEERAGAEREEAARRAEEDGRREAARVALESARAAEEQRQSELKRRADAARRALEAARAAEDAWRRAQQGTQLDPALADTLSSRPPVTDSEFPAPAEPPPPNRGPHRHSHRSGVPGPFQPDPGTHPDPDAGGAGSEAPPVPEEAATGHQDTGRMGSPLGWEEPSGEEDTLVRAVRAAAGQTDPYAPPVTLDGWIPLRRAGPAPTRTRPGNRARPTPTPRRCPARTPRARRPHAAVRNPGDPHPARGLAHRRAAVFEPEALLIPETRPLAADLREELSEALRRAGSEAPPELWSTPSTEAVGSKPAERTPLRLGPQGAEEADLWKLVEGAPTEAPASFEAALRQVDGQLESLAGLGKAPRPRRSAHHAPRLGADRRAGACLVRLRQLDPRARTTPPGGVRPRQRSHRARGAERHPACPRLPRRCPTRRSCRPSDGASCSSRREPRSRPIPPLRCPRPRHARWRTPSWPTRSRRATPRSAATPTGSPSSA